MNYQKNLTEGLLEWPYKVNYDAVNRVQVDILAVGGSFAGCFAALAAEKRGATVAVVDKAPIRISGNGGAGIDHWNSIFENPKSPMSSEEVISKTLEKVETLGHRDYIAIKGTWNALLELEKMGLPIRDEDGDFIDSRSYDDSGLLKAYNYRDMVSIKLRGGHFIKQVIFNALKQQKKISLYERIMIVSLLTENGKVGARVIGAVGFSLETGEMYVFQAKSVIIATGYILGCWTFNTELAGNGFREDPNDSGDGLAMAWKAGAEIYGLNNAGRAGSSSPISWPLYGFGNCTNTWFPCSIVDDEGKEIPWADVNGDIIETVEGRNMPVKGQPYMNVGSSDKMKGVDTPDLIPDLGAKIKKGEYTMPLWADLPDMPVDERRSIWGMMIGNEGKTRYSIYDYYTKWGFDPEQDLLMGVVGNPAENASGHGWFTSAPGETDNITAWRAENRAYGNIACDWNLMTNLPGLFCAGAASGLEGCSFACSSGEYAGNRAFEYASKVEFLEPDPDQIERERKHIYAPIKRCGEDNNYVSWKELWAGSARVMQTCCGEFKSIPILKYGIGWLESIKDYEVNLTYARNPHELARVLECETRITCSEAFMHGCLYNQELDEQKVSGRNYIFTKLTDEGVKSFCREHEYWLKEPYADNYLENYNRFRSREREIS